jgi:N-acetylglucosaminyl-diphospho-decaprenol L-rhamnosyltransferase
MKPKASIIILDFFKSKRVVKNVESIVAQKVDFEYEIIIVDNSANPLNAQKLAPLNKYPNIKIFINETNIGYVSGNNRGVKRAKGEYIFIVNPDIIWGDTHNFQNLINYMDKHPGIGVLGPKQINDCDGSIAMTVRAFPTLLLQIARRTSLRNVPVLRSFVAHDECRDMNYSLTQNVDWLQSSFWVTRQSLWNKIGGLDKRYLIFMSDPDYCWKCWKEGFEVVYYPKVIVHADGIRASCGGLKEFFKKWILRQHFKDAIKYSISHMFRWNPRLRYYRSKFNT